MAENREPQLNRDELLPARTKAEKLEISPEIPEDFVEKLERAIPILDHYQKYRSLYIDMNNPQNQLTRDEMITRFKESPTLFHSTGNTGWKLNNIATQGLNTEKFRERFQNLYGIDLSKPQEESGRSHDNEDFSKYDEYTDEDWEKEFWRLESEMDQAQKKMAREYSKPKYNRKCISFSWIPWWNERSVRDDKPHSDYEFDINGNLEGLEIAIAIDAQTTKKIVTNNLPEINKEDGGIESKVIFDYAEVLRPFRVAPRHFGAIFVKEGKLDNIEDDRKRKLFVAFIEQLGKKSGSLIFNFYGDLLYPVQMSYEEVIKFVEERDKDKKDK